jgi:hypothetical protein
VPKISAESRKAFRHRNGQVVLHTRPGLAPMDSRIRVFHARVSRGFGEPKLKFIRLDLSLLRLHFTDKNDEL